MNLNSNSICITQSPKVTTLWPEIVGIAICTTLTNRYSYLFVRTIFHYNYSLRHGDETNSYDFAWALAWQVSRWRTKTGTCQVVRGNYQTYLKLFVQILYIAIVKVLDIHIMLKLNSNRMYMGVLKWISCLSLKMGHGATVALKDRRTVNANWYTSIYFPEVIVDIKRNDVNRRIILHHDDASSHTPPRTVDFFTRNNIQLMTHCPFSLDISPNEFLLFVRLQK